MTFWGSFVSLVDSFGAMDVLWTFRYIILGEKLKQKTTRAKRLSEDHSQKEPGRIVFPRESKITDFEVTGDVGQEVVARPRQLLENKS